MTNQPSQPERLKAEMPRIPGVNDAQGSAGRGRAAGSSALARVAVVVALCVAGALGWWAMRANRGKAHVTASYDPLPEVAQPVAAPVLPAEPPVTLAGPKLTRSGATVVASLDELAKPWSSKRFTFADPAQHENVAALIIRLPGAATSHESYWAFALAAPFKTSCDLDYLTDPAQISARFGYRASHPMVVAACDASVYDPLHVQTVGSGAWVRGEVVSGTGIRPPLSIDIAVQGDTIVADRME